MFFLQEGFIFRNFVVDAFTIFVFIVWFWLLISVASDLFRISGWAKAIWVIVLIVAPYIGVLAYLIFQGRGMAERNLQLTVAMEAVGDKIRLNSQGWEDARVIGERQGADGRGA